MTRRRGGTVDTVLLISIYVLCILFTYLYLKRENTDFSQAKDSVGDLKTRVSSLEASRVEQDNKIDASSKDAEEFATTTVSQLSRLTDQLKSVGGDKTLRVILPKEPIVVSLVYRKAPEDTKISDPVVSAAPKVKPLIPTTPLLNRAGIRKKTVSQ